MEYIDTGRTKIDITVTKKPDRGSPRNTKSRADAIGTETIRISIPDERDKPEIIRFRAPMAGSTKRYSFAFPGIIKEPTAPKRKKSIPVFKKYSASILKIFLYYHIGI